jgi:hypothetical protein
MFVGVLGGNDPTLRWEEGRAYVFDVWRRSMFAFSGLLLLVSSAFGQQSAIFGVETADVSEEDAGKLGWFAPEGAKAIRVQPGSPADKAGIGAGDILHVLGGVIIENASHFETLLKETPPGVPM